MGDTVQNECNVITIFPMVIECMGVNPSTPTASDGQMSVSITGGTPPYTIIWSNGNVSPAINNLSVGEYSVTVIDYYGDFSAETSCTLSTVLDCDFGVYVQNFTVEPTPTPTLTQTLTATATLTPTPTPTLTTTPGTTSTMTPTRTVTPTLTRTLTPTLTRTLTPTPTLTRTKTPTPTPTPTMFNEPCNCVRYQFNNPDYDKTGPVTVSTRYCYDPFEIIDSTFSGYYFSACGCEGYAVAPSFVTITNLGVDNCQD